MITEINSRIATQRRHLATTKDRHTGSVQQREVRAARHVAAVQALQGVLALLGVTPCERTKHADAEPLGPIRHIECDNCRTPTPIGELIDCDVMVSCHPCHDRCPL